MDQRGSTGGKIDFVAVGHLAVDLRGGRRLLGGSAAYSALTASRLGLSTAIVTAVGEDFDLWDALEGIEIQFHRGGRTTTFENVYSAGRRTQRLRGRARAIEAEDLAVLRDRSAEDAIVLFCPIAGEIHAPLGRLAGAGLCGVAPQGFFRRWDEQGRVHSAPWLEAEHRLAGVDLLSLSVEDPPEPERFRGRVSGKVSILAMTEGKAGARIHLAERTYHVPAFQARAVDPTGAGDVFAGAFLVALREGRPPLDAARFAVCAASFAVEAEGVEGVPPARKAVEERLQTYRTTYRSREHLE